MPYSPISSSVIAAWKANVQDLWTQIRDNFAAHQQRLNALEVPPGLVAVGTICFYGSATVPTGYLACTGQAVSRTTYADLFTLIGTTYGAGDGSTTFNLPNLQGVVPIGVGTGSGLTARALAAAVGAETHQLTTAEMGNHTHALNPASPTHKHNGVATLSGGGTHWHFHNAPSYAANQNTSVVTSPATVNLTIGSTGSNTPHANVQPSLVVNFIIKT